MTDTAATPPRHPHEGYVHAAAAELAQHGIQAGQLTLHTDADHCRGAAMTLTQRYPLAAMWHESEWIRLSWSDHQGWQVQVHWRGEDTPRAPAAFGITATPPAHELAQWVAVFLIHPELVARVDDTPISTADLEEVLAAYTT